jgi:hypothetical protein
VNNAILQFGPMTHDVPRRLHGVDHDQVGVFLGMRGDPGDARNAAARSSTSSTNGFVGYSGAIAYTAAKFACGA